MAMRIPTIVSNTKIDKYYFNDSLVKFFNSENEKDLAESMLLLIKNKNIRNNLKENSFKYIQNNNWDVKKNIYLNIVDSLVKKQYKPWINKYLVGILKCQILIGL